MVLAALPKSIEYAVKVLVCLCLSTGRPVSSTEVAQRVRIPVSQAAKTLHFLSWAGLTRSRRGPRGGYMLGQPAEEIQLEQIVRFFQPNAGEEPSSNSDPLLEIWAEASASLERDWGQLTISELARRTAGRWGTSNSAGSEL